MFREIGSEFEYPEIPARGAGNRPALPVPERYCCTFTGRGALELVLKDSGVRGRALLPSWCCESMIEPFQRQGLDVSFYRVEADRQEDLCLRVEDIPEDCRVLLLCSYFGFESPEVPEGVVSRVREMGGVVIRDFTHSLLGGNPIPGGGDYAVASLRKGLPLLCGGMAVSFRGPLRYRPEGQPDPAFLSLRRQAMWEKKAYADAGYRGNKESFLELYARANSLLREKAYAGETDRDSLAWIDRLDWEEIRARRRRNARVLYRELRGLDGVRPLFSEERMDCPLFVPVLLGPEERTPVRQVLIRKGIYCPVHWPRPDAGCDSGLYDTELSLICDQRYDEADMEREAEVLREALKGKTA